MKKMFMLFVCAHVLTISCVYANVSVKANGTYTVDAYGASWQDTPTDFQRKATNAELGIGPEHQLTPEYLLDTKGVSHW